MLDSKEVTINDKEYVLTKFDCLSGREIGMGYAASEIPKQDEYRANEATMFKLMAFVGVNLGTKIQMLTTSGLIKNHVPDFGTLLELERQMIAYNTSFFPHGSHSNSLQESVASLPE